MVQILPRAPSSRDRFAQAFSNLSSAAAQEIPQELMGRQERRQLGNLIGEDISNIRNPDFQKQILASGLERRKQESAYEADKENYENIKNAFGKKFADTWLASGQGERTFLTKAALEARSRGLDINELLGGEQEFEENEKLQQIQKGENTEFPEIPMPPHRTQAEKIKYQDRLRADNKKIFKENVDKGRALKDTYQHLEILRNLNPKIPEGVSRLLIDKEGNIRPTALRLKAVPKEVERFAKTVNDFLTSAKDTFGARVTNYDIAQFKARLPNLLNSKEGREEIIQQMQILTQIEQNYRNALKKIYSHYGLDGIPEEQAEALAEQMTAQEEERLRAKLLTIGEEEKEFSSQKERQSLEDIFG